MKRLTAITADQTLINSERAKEALTETTLGKTERDQARWNRSCVRRREGAGSGKPRAGKDHGPRDASRRDAPQIIDDYRIGD